jgi:hypothetical protein
LTALATSSYLGQAMPIIGPKEPLLGNKKQVNKQYHSGRFHIRHYRDYYTVPMDRVGPLSSPLGHPLVDVPE